jgi:hypothetical protein
MANSSWRFMGYLLCEISIQTTAARASSLAPKPQSRNADELRTSYAGSIASVWIAR